MTKQNMTKQKMQDIIRQFIAVAREAHRTGDVVRRRQAEENIREVAPRAYAEKVIREMYAS